MICLSSAGSLAWFENEARGPKSLSRSVSWVHIGATLPYCSPGRTSCSNAKTMPLLPEERGWHIVWAHRLEPLFSVHRKPAASYDSCTPKIPNAFRLTRYRHPTQGRDTLDRDNHSPLNGCKPRLPHKRSHVDGTIPQTGVLMVTHERNMRSKFRWFTEPCNSH